eukprot:gene15865-17463_t
MAWKIFLFFIPCFVNTIIPWTRSSFEVQADACGNYRTLQDAERAVTHSEEISNRCDMNLTAAWYRFSGQAGNRLLSSCPAATTSKKYRCGSYYQGWLQASQPHPSVSEGEVTRTVCFTSADSCDQCDYTKQIKIKNCGQFYVYFLDGVPACNATYCGEKTTGQIVHCSSNYMRIELDQSYYNRSLYSSITLRSSSCKASYSTSHIILGTVLGGCGSTSRVHTVYITYENQVTMKAISSNGIIVREPDRYITFRCSFPSNKVLSVASFDVIREVNSTEPGFGNFKMQMDMHPNSFYNTKYNSFPVGVRTTDQLFFEAITTASDEYVLLIDQCFSTPTKDRNHADKRLFINARCGTRSDVKFYSTTRSKHRFSIAASELLKSRKEAFVHCVLFLCYHKTTEQRMCKSGCAGNNLQRTSRSVNINNNNSVFRPPDVSQLYLVEIGAIQKEKDQGGSAVKFQAQIYLVLAAMVITGIA